MISVLHVLLIDDHPLFRSALKPIVRELALSVEIAEAASIAEAFILIDQLDNLDLVLLDLNLPDASGMKTLIPVCQLLKETPVVVVSANENRKLIINTIHACARGYIPKSASNTEIKNALTLVLAGSIYIPPIAVDIDAENLTQDVEEMTALTQRQSEVLQQLAEGLSNKQIASQLKIAETTVRVHVSDIIHLLHANNRTDAVIKAQKLGLLIL